MVRERRPKAGFLGILTALLLAFGASPTAFACPLVAAVSAESLQSAADDCDHAGSAGCFAKCGTLCTIVAPAPADISHGMLAPGAQFRRATDIIEPNRFGPDPPPPRTG